MTEDYNYKQGQLVDFNLSLTDGILSGRGFVIGAASCYIPPIGANYIIKPIEFTGNITIPSADYPFECLCIGELHLLAATNEQDN